MIGDSLDGVLIPIPQYPLYSVWVPDSVAVSSHVLVYDASNEAAITRLGGTYIGYELMEDYTSGKGRQNNISLQEGWHGLHFE